MVGLNTHLVTGNASGDLNPNAAFIGFIGGFSPKLGAQVYARSTSLRKRLLDLAREEYSHSA